MSFFKIEPWAHQAKTFEKCKRRKFFALFYEMGTGKTATVINIVRYKFALHKKVLKTLKEEKKRLVKEILDLE